MVRTGLLIAALLAVGCEAKLPPESTFIGRVSGSDAVFALAIAEDRAVGYSCGGQDSLEQLTMWFSGEVHWYSDGSLHVDCGDFHLHAFVGDQISGGVISLKDGSSHDFIASAIEDDGVGGVYSDGVDPCPTGAIVYRNDEGEIAVQGAYCAGVFRQVTPMSPMLTESGIAVEVPFDTDTRWGVHLQPLAL